MVIANPWTIGRTIRICQAVIGTLLMVCEMVIVITDKGEAGSE